MEMPLMGENRSMENGDRLQSLSPQLCGSQGLSRQPLSPAGNVTCAWWPELPRPLSRTGTGNPLEGSGVFPSWFLPPCKQEEGTGCCHLSSHSVPSAASCCSHRPPHTHRDGTGRTAKSPGSGSRCRVLEQHFKEFWFFTAFNVQHQWNGGMHFDTPAAVFI